MPARKRILLMLLRLQQPRQRFQTNLDPAEQLAATDLSRHGGSVSRRYPTVCGQRSAPSLPHSIFSSKIDSLR